jgi:molybdate transport repressor ModE-like protein
VHTVGARSHPAWLRMCMDVDPDDLRFVGAIGEHGSLLAAARALGVDKATVIRRVDALEEALGAKVVDRTPHGWRVTESGRHAIEASERVRQAIEALRSTISGQVGGVVRATVPAWIARAFYIPAMGAFRAEWPAIDLRLVTTNAVLDLGKREADVALRNVRPTQARLTLKKCGVLGCGVYASKGYIAQRGMPSDVAELRRHHLVGYEGKLVHPGEHQFLVESGAPVAFRTTDTLSLLDAIKAGLGIGSIPCAAADPEPDVVRLPFPVSQDDIFVVFPDDLRDVPSVRAVIDWLAAVWHAHDAILSGASQA